MYTAIVLGIMIFVLGLITWILTRFEFINRLIWHALNMLTLRDEEKLTYEEYLRAIKDEQKNMKKQGRKIIHGERRKKTAKRYRKSIKQNTLLVSKNFTKPFKEPIQYGKHIAQLSNMLCDGKILVQRFGDFVRGRRTTEERLVRNNITPTLKDAVPGDLSLVFPYRIMKDIEEMIYALDEVTPGMASDETLLYGVEVKFYSNKILTNKDFETNIKGLRAIGDGASVTRGLQQASANGLSVAKSILNK